MRSVPDLVPTASSVWYGVIGCAVCLMMHGVFTGGGMSDGEECVPDLVLAQYGGTGYVVCLMTRGVFTGGRGSMSDGEECVPNLVLAQYGGISQSAKRGRF